VSAEWAERDTPKPRARIWLARSGARNKPLRLPWRSCSHRQAEDGAGAGAPGVPSAKRSCNSSIGRMPATTIVVGRPSARSWLGCQSGAGQPGSSVVDQEGRESGGCSHAAKAIRLKSPCAQW